MSDWSCSVKTNNFQNDSSLKETIIICISVNLGLLIYYIKEAKTTICLLHHCHMSFPAA